MDISYTSKQGKWAECNAYKYICYKVGMFGVILTVKNAQMRDTPDLRGVWEFCSTFHTKWVCSSFVHLTYT